MMRYKEISDNPESRIEILVGTAQQRYNCIQYALEMTSDPIPSSLQ